MEGNFPSEAAYHSGQSASEPATDPSRQKGQQSGKEPTGASGRLFNTIMAYGSGKPAWARGGGGSDDGGESGLNRRNNANGSYQQGDGDESNNYQAPQLTGAYADQQTQVVEDTMRNQVQAENTAGNVLALFHAQRHQLQNAHDDVYTMRETAAQAKRELAELKTKAMKKKRRLYILIGILGSVDFLLFSRIVQCHGNFFC